MVGVFCFAVIWVFVCVGGDVVVWILCLAGVLCWWVVWLPVVCLAVFCGGFAAVCFCVGFLVSGLFASWGCILVILRVLAMLLVWFVGILLGLVVCWFDVD